MFVPSLVTTTAFFLAGGTTRSYYCRRQLLLSSTKDAVKTHLSTTTTSTRTRLFSSASPPSSSSSSSSSKTNGHYLTPLLDVDGVTLLSSEGDLLQKKLRGKRVGLYFGAGWCPMCRSVEPSLLKFIDAANESDQPIELIYISSDRSEQDQIKRVQSGNLQMLSIPYGDERAAELKRQYKVWSGSESFQFGVLGRRSGVPAIVVLDNVGEELAFVPLEAQGIKSLSLWPLDDDENGIW